MANEQMTSIRKMIIEAILHTDMSKHFAMISSMKGLILSSSTTSTSEEEDENDDSTTKDCFKLNDFISILY